LSVRWQLARVLPRFVPSTRPDARFASCTLKDAERWLLAPRGSHAPA
jgi:hypothetical protein